MSRNATLLFLGLLLFCPIRIFAAEYVIAPYGESNADYFCDAMDCGTTFQSVFNVIKASGGGGKIKLREGTYKFASGVNASDADSVIVEGIYPGGIGGSGGTAIQRTADIVVFDFSTVTKNPRGCLIKNIHFIDSAGYSNPVLKYVNAHSMAQEYNYFDNIPQAILASVQLLPRKSLR